MTITANISLRDFEAWSGARQTLNRLINTNTVEDFESVLEDLYPDGINETALNDILWFDDEWVFETVGLKTYDEIYSEIEDIKVQMEDIKDAYEYDIRYREEELKIELCDSDKEEIWNVDYKKEYEALMEEYNELKEEINA